MRTVSLFIAICLLSGINLQAAQYELGLIVGHPTGLSGKMDLNSGSGVDVALGIYSRRYDKKDHDDAESRVYLHADYLLYKYDLLPIRQGRFGFYYGAGGKIFFGDETNVGLRIPLGGSYEFEPVPLNLFLELVPVLDLTPGTDFDINAAIGLRYCFGSRSVKGRSVSSGKKNSGSTVEIEQKKEDGKEEKEEDSTEEDKKNKKPPKVKIKW